MTTASTNVLLDIRQQQLASLPTKTMKSLSDAMVTLLLADVHFDYTDCAPGVLVVPDLKIAVITELGNEAAWQFAVRERCAHVVVLPDGSDFLRGRIVAELERLIAEMHPA